MKNIYTIARTYREGHVHTKWLHSPSQQSVKYVRNPKIIVDTHPFNKPDCANAPGNVNKDEPQKHLKRLMNASQRDNELFFESISEIIVVLLPSELSLDSVSITLLNDATLSIQIWKRVIWCVWLYPLTVYKLNCCYFWFLFICCGHHFVTAWYLDTLWSETIVLVTEN